MIDETEGRRAGDYGRKRDQFLGIPAGVDSLRDYWKDRLNIGEASVDGKMDDPWSTQEKKARQHQTR